MPDEKELFEKQYNEINWAEVDVYPSMDVCENQETEDQKRQCFFQYITNNILEKLKETKLLQFYSKKDTVQVKVTINADATLKFELENSPKLPSKVSVETDSILNSNLSSLDKINPAIKRGLPVKTEFIVPIILNPSK